MVFTLSRIEIRLGVCPPYDEVNTIANLCPKERNSVFSITYPSIEANTLVSISPCTAYGAGLPCSISGSGKPELPFGTGSELPLECLKYP